MESKQQQFDRIGIQCTKYTNNCGYGKCETKNEEGKKIETVVIDVIPHIHSLETFEGKIINEIVKDYFLKQVEECKEEKTVLNIFFESLMGSEFSYDFAQDPEWFIEKTEELEEKEKEISINELQFKYYLIKELAEWKEKQVKIRNVIINFIAVPSLKDYEPYFELCKKIAKKVNSIFERCNVTIEPWGYTEVLFLIRDIEASTDLFILHEETKTYLPENVEIISEVLYVVQNELKKLKGSMIGETREYLSILSILKYIKKEKLEKSYVHKYFLVFGLKHKFYMWNNVDLTKITPYKDITVKFINNLPTTEPFVNPVDKVVEGFIRIKK